MKVLLDNCIDWRVRRLFPQHDIIHAKDLGWANLSNGRLLAEAAKAGFAVMITVDKKIKFEQNLDHLPLTVIEIDLPDSRLASIKTVLDKLNDALAQANQFRFLSINENEITMKVPRG